MEGRRPASQPSGSIAAGAESTPVAISLSLSHTHQHTQAHTGSHADADAEADKSGSHEVSQICTELGWN